MSERAPAPNGDWRRRIKLLLLDLDARLDFTVFRTGKWARELYERFTAMCETYARRLGRSGPEILPEKSGDTA